MPAPFPSNAIDVEDDPDHLGISDELASNILFRVLIANPRGYLLASGVRGMRALVRRIMASHVPGRVFVYVMLYQRIYPRIICAGLGMVA